MSSFSFVPDIQGVSLDWAIWDRVSPNCGGFSVVNVSTYYFDRHANVIESCINDVLQKMFYNNSIALYLSYPLRVRGLAQGHKMSVNVIPVLDHINFPDPIVGTFILFEGYGTIEMLTIRMT